MKKQSGYSLIEVSLFLAISASMIVLTIGLAQLIDRQRFQDAMVTLRGIFQSQYEEVRSGINARVGSGSEALDVCNTSRSGEVPGTSEGCLVVGKYIDWNEMLSGFTDNPKIEIGYIVMKENTALEGKSDFEQIRESEFYRVSSEEAGAKEERISTPVGGRLSYSCLVNFEETHAGGCAGVRSISIIRAPESGAIYTFYNANPDDRNSISDYLNSIIDRDDELVGHDLAVFVKNEGNGLDGAALCIDGGSSSSNVRIKYFDGTLKFPDRSYHVEPTGSASAINDFCKN